jgi:hypothetical protein
MDSYNKYNPFKIATKLSLVILGIALLLFVTYFVATDLNWYKSANHFKNWSDTSNFWNYYNVILTLLIVVFWMPLIKLFEKTDYQEVSSLMRTRWQLLALFWFAAELLRWIS